MTTSAVPSMLVVAGDSENSAAAFNQQIWRRNKNADRILRDTAQWLYPGIIYVQNVMPFYRTHVHVTSLMSCWKVQPSLHQFSLNSHIVNSIMCKSLTQNFTKTGQHMCKVWIQIHLCPSVRYGCQCTNFHEIYSISINFCGQILHWISPKSNKAENRGKISFMPLSKVQYQFHWADLTKLNPPWQLFVNNYYTKFHENLANSLVAVIGSQTNRWMAGRTDRWVDVVSFSCYFIMNN